MEQDNKIGKRRMCLPTVVLEDRWRKWERDVEAGSLPYKRTSDSRGCRG